MPRDGPNLPEALVTEWLEAGTIGRIELDIFPNQKQWNLAYTHESDGSGEKLPVHIQCPVVFHHHSVYVRWTIIEPIADEET